MRERWIGWEPAECTSLRLREGVFLGAILFVMTVGAFLHPDPHGMGTHQQLHLPPCTFAAVTGRPCPACGLTTSFTAMMHGELVTAFRAHAFGPALFSAMIAYGFAIAYGASRGLRLRLAPGLGPKLGVAFMTVFLAYGAVRCWLWR